jgi:hypothetical protein
MMKQWLPIYPDSHPKKTLEASSVGSHQMLLVQVMEGAASLMLSMASSAEVMDWCSSSSQFYY